MGTKHVMEGLRWRTRAGIAFLAALLAAASLMALGWSGNSRASSCGSPPVTTIRPLSVTIDGHEQPDLSAYYGMTGSLLGNSLGGANLVVRDREGAILFEENYRAP